MSTREEIEKDLTVVINKHSLENESDTPDFVLGAYLYQCITAWNIGVNYRNMLDRTKDMFPCTK